MKIADIALAMANDMKESRQAFEHRCLIIEENIERLLKILAKKKFDKTIWNIK